MTKQNWIIALLLAALTINLFTWANIKELRQEQSRVQSEMSSLRSQVSSEVSGIRGTFENIRDDSRWWTPAQMEVLNINKETATATIRLSWQLREYLQGNRVALNYQIGDGDFQEVAAKESANGFFSVDLTIAMPLEPMWHIYLQRESGGRQASFGIAPQHESAVNEYILGGSEPGAELKYYISVLDGETTRTSDMQLAELSKLSYNL